MWEIKQYPGVIESFRSRASQGLWDEMLISLAMLQEKGNGCRRPVSAPLQDGIFELRARDGTLQGAFALLLLGRKEAADYCRPRVCQEDQASRSA